MDLKRENSLRQEFRKILFDMAKDQEVLQADTASRSSEEPVSVCKCAKYKREIIYKRPSLQQFPLTERSLSVAIIFSFV